MGFPWISLGRWTSSRRKHSNTHHRPWPSSTHPAIAARSNSSVTASGFVIHTHGVAETMAWVRGESQCILHELYEARMDAERRVRSRKSEADAHLRRRGHFFRPPPAPTPVESFEVIRQTAPVDRPAVPIARATTPVSRSTAVPDAEPPREVDGHEGKAKEVKKATKPPRNSRFREMFDEEDADLGCRTGGGGGPPPIPPLLMAILEETDALARGAQMPDSGPTMLEETGRSSTAPQMVSAPAPGSTRSDSPDTPETRAALRDSYVQDAPPTSPEPPSDAVEADPPHPEGFNIPRPAAPLTWYEDDEESFFSGGAFDARYGKSVTDLTDLSSDAIVEKARHLSMRRFEAWQVVQTNKPPRHTQEVEIPLAAAQDDVDMVRPTTSHGITTPDRSISFDTKSNKAFIETTPKVSPSHPSVFDEPSLHSPSEPDAPASPSSSDSSLDDIFDFYVSSPSPDLPSPSAFPVPPSLTPGVDIPPFLPDTLNAEPNLAVIRAGLSLPPSTPFEKIQSHLARNATILRYLVLHLVPSPSINPVEDETDLVEPLLPIHRREANTRLLQAIRSIYWTANIIPSIIRELDSLTLHDPYATRRRAFNPIRKLRAADARNAGRLTAAQAHRLDELGAHELAGVPDLSRILRAGLGNGLIMMAECGALETVRESGVLEEEGMLFKLLSEVGPKIEADPAEMNAIGVPSGLRVCVNVDQVDDDEETGEEVKSVVSVSPISSEEAAWEAMSPVEMHSARLEELNAFFEYIQSPTLPSPIKDSPVGDSHVEGSSQAARSPALLRLNSFRTEEDGTILVDEGAAQSPELRRFFEDIGVEMVVMPTATAVDAETVEIAMRRVRQIQGLLAPGTHRQEDTAWGVNLGGILEA